MGEFTPITKGKSFEKQMPVTTFLRDRFFGKKETFLTDEVEFDFYKGGQEVALFVARNAGGINVKRDSFQTRRYTAPLVAPQMPLSKEVLNVRSFGDTIHTAKSPEERQKELMRRDARKMNDMITRREELMCADLISSGKIIVKGYLDDSREHFVTDEIDYGFTNQDALTGDALWSSAKADLFQTFEEAAESVMQAGYNPQVTLVGGGAAKKLMTNEKFLKRFDYRGVQVGTMAPQTHTLNGNGYRYLGYLSDLGLELYTYLAWYLDENKQKKPYFPDNKIAVLPDGLGSICYGAVTQLEKDEKFHTREGIRIPKIWADINNDVKMSRISSRPLPKPFDVDAWAVRTVL